MATGMLTENGRTGGARKTLAAEIDRLDNILDGFADALNEAVETAVKASVRQAAAEVLREELAGMLRDPGTLQRLREALAPAPVPTNATPPVTGKREGWQVFRALREDWNGVRLGVSQRWDCLREGVGERWDRFTQGCADAWGWVCGLWAAMTATVWAWLVLVWLLRREIVIAAGVTVAVSCLATAGGPVVIGLLAALETFAIALVILIRQKARRPAGREELPSS